MDFSKELTKVANSLKFASEKQVFDYFSLDLNSFVRDVMYEVQSYLIKINNKYKTTSLYVHNDSKYSFNIYDKKVIQEIFEANVSFVIKEKIIEVNIEINSQEGNIVKSLKYNCNDFMISIVKNILFEIDEFIEKIGY